MDRPIEKKSFIRRYALYIAAAVAVVALLTWIVFGSTASTMTVERADVTVSDVTRGKFDDYVRLNGQVVPIQVVQISPEEGGIVREKVVEEGTRVKKGDVILRLSNSNLDLQILNAEAELAEKQNLLRNTQVAMQQDRLNNRTEEATLDMDCNRKLRAFQQNSRLYKEKLISKEVYLQSREDYNLAQRKQRLIGQRLKQDSVNRHVQMAVGVLCHIAHLSGKILPELAPYYKVGCRSVIGPVPQLLWMMLYTHCNACVNSTRSVLFCQ